ncbi:hypothetical protein GGI20_002346 [Coemansia sp. BCRC 34301]|nr:hypothetical protein GGI20_002346 [Coemansia sp. BCRC 34301]
MNKRLLSEYKLLQNELPPGIICTLKDEVRMDRYEARIDGPPDSPYESGRFFVDIMLSETYGVDPPSVKFKTRIYHPNIDDHGNICLDVLKTGNKGAWAPSWTLDKVLLALQQLMAKPNADDPLMPEIAEQKRNDPGAFARAAAEWTTRYATAFYDDPDEYISASQFDDNAKPARGAGAAKADQMSAAVEASALTGGRCKLGPSRKSATASESPAGMLPPPGPGKPATSSGMLRLGLRRSRNTVPARIASSSDTAPSLGHMPLDSLASESPAESIEVASDEDSSSVSNSLYVCESDTTNRRSSQSPSSVRVTRRSSLAEILASSLSSSSAAVHKRPLKSASPTPSAKSPSPSRRPAKSKMRKTVADNVLLLSPPSLPSWPAGDKSDDLGLLSSQSNYCGGASTLSQSLVGGDSLGVGMGVDLSEGIEEAREFPIAAVYEAPPTEEPAAKEESPVKEVAFLSDMPALTPIPKPEPETRVVAAKSKGKGKAVDYQTPVQSAASKRSRCINEGQVLTESHFGPLDLGLKPIRVSANRSLLRRKPRKDDGAI